MERERELEAIGRLLEAAARGEGGAAVLDGPAGIGKSRLLAAAAASAHDLRVLRARASELEHDYPFGVVRQLFERVLFAADASERERLLAGAGGLAEGVLDSAAAAPAGDPDDAFAVMHGLYWFVANLAGPRPLLVLVDDAQWSDAASLRWFGFLLRRLAGMPVALLLAVRSGEPGGERAPLEELVADPGVQVIRPGVISDAGVAQMLEQALGEAPDAAFLAACQRATAGNPFLVRELLRELVDRGIGATAEHAGVIPRLSATSVGRAVRARVRRLPHGCIELARAVSVLGDGCELWLATRLAELDEAEAARAADALAAASILEPSRPLEFVHPLVRSSVYVELASGERSAWHARAAALLDEERVGADRVAVHLLASEPRGEEQTVETLREAATSARRRDAHDVAATYLRRALREPPAPDREPQVLHELGSAELRAGEISPALEHLAGALQRTTTAPQRARVTLELANALVDTDRTPDAVDVLSHALEELSSGETDLAESLAAMRAVVSYSSLGARRRYQAHSDTPAPRGGEPQTTAQRLLLGSQAFEEMLAGSAARARSQALRALGDGALLEATGMHHAPFFLPVMALIWGHAFDDAEHHLQAAMADARRRGSRNGFGRASYFRAGLCWQRGALGELEVDARTALDPPSAPFGTSLAAVRLSDAFVERGDVDAAAAELRAVGLDAATPEPIGGVFALTARANIHVARQQPREAVSLLLECGRREEAWGMMTPSFTNWRAEAAVLLRGLGESEQARDLADEAVRRADAFGSAVARGIALRASALVAQPADSDGLAASVALLRDSGARLELARSLVELGGALRRAGHRADAREPLRESIDAAVECGAEALARRAHDELVAAGSRPRRDPVESRTKLTAAELRVAGLAAQGMTNREVAQALFLTENTIETHLRKVFRKLDISSRSQLPRALEP
jgi:DNA-binding CsgD family transcriptional regulator